MISVFASVLFLSLLPKVGSECQTVDLFSSTALEGVVRDKLISLYKQNASSQFFPITSHNLHYKNTLNPFACADLDLAREVDGKNVFKVKIFSSHFLPLSPNAN